MFVTAVSLSLFIEVEVYNASLLHVDYNHILFALHGKIFWQRWEDTTADIRSTLKGLTLMQIGRCLHAQFWDTQSAKWCI